MKYKKFEQTHYQDLKTLLPHCEMLFGKEITDDYSHDELSGEHSFPDAVVFPQSTKDVSVIAKYAYQKDIPLTVRGSGTGLVGGAVPLCGGILLVTSKMNQILDYDEKNLTLSVQCGVLLMDINKFLEDKNLFYPPDPGEKSATIGGNISTNAGGMRAVKYGVTRDYVLGLECVLMSGEIVNLGGKTVKNSSGYSLKDLICGSEGTLAIVCTALLKLIPKPKVSISLLIPFSNLEDAIKSVPQIITRSPALPTAIEFTQRETILFAEEYMNKKFPNTDYPAYVILTFDGKNRKQVEEDCAEAAYLCIDELNAKDAFKVDTDERLEIVWSARGVFLEAIKASTPKMDECDVVVPRDKITHFLSFVSETAKKHQIRINSFGHAGDGNLHVYVCSDKLSNKEFKEKLEKVFDELYNKAEELGGKVSGEHGIGSAKRKYLIKTLGAEYAVMKKIKASFDEKNLLNPEKII